MGCGSAWLERLVCYYDAAGSNPVTPTWNFLPIIWPLGLMDRTRPFHGRNVEFKPPRGHCLLQCPSGLWCCPAKTVILRDPVVRINPGAFMRRWQSPVYCASLENLRW